MVLSYRTFGISLRLTGVTLASALGFIGCAGPTGSTHLRPAMTTTELPDPLVVADPGPLPVPPVDPGTNGVRKNQPSTHANLTDAPPLSPGHDGITNWGSTPTPGPLLLAGQPWPNSWTNVWVPIETWARVNGLGHPTQLVNGPESIYVLRSPMGPVRLKIGDRAAHAGNHDSHLGFAPRLVGGIPYVHSLDLQKTLQPLLSGNWQPPATNRVIVLDPGHGGRDSGTRNGFGAENEKQFTLDWARRLEQLLTASGWKVILTRTNDIDVPLAERVAVAERAHADLFVSLHFNSGVRNTEMSGIETYCLTPSGLPSTLRRDFEDDPREILPNNAHDQFNILVASQVHQALLNATGAPDRGVRRARFMTVLRGQNRPAVLIEGGYLSNVFESRRIQTPAYRQKLAEAIAQALGAPDAPAAPESNASATSASTSSPSSPANRGAINSTATAAVTGASNTSPTSAGAANP